ICPLSCPRVALLEEDTSTLQLLRDAAATR
ncbi:hypothetical protein CgunFtcFv8_027888, partial [Champsocephalus gunnari]